MNGQNAKATGQGGFGQGRNCGRRAGGGRRQGGHCGRDTGPRAGMRLGRAGGEQAGDAPPETDDAPAAAPMAETGRCLRMRRRDGSCIGK